jgi:hypothetical protein
VAPPLPSGPPDRDVLAIGARGVVAWCVVLLAAAAVLAGLDYRTRDPDSRLHVQIEAGLARAPVGRWIAPEWPPRWYMSGLYREHPVGIFLPPALLGRLGYPAEQAGYVANAAYQVLALLLIQRLASTFVDPGLARPLGWLIQVLPIAFTYRIRANHEAALLLCILAALLGVERSRTRAGWGALAVAALVGLTLVKGVLALPGFLVCAAWLLARGRDDAGRVPVRSWAWLGAAGLACLGLAAGYEALYRAATGQPFLSEYLGRQLGAAAVAQSEGVVAQKLYNAVWHLGRVLWFPFPWSLVMLAAAASMLFRRLRPGAALHPAEDGPPDVRARRGFLFAVLLVAVYVGLFSLSDRRADRYIFPAYYAVGACGAVMALRLWPRFGRAVERADRLHPYLPVAVWAATFTLHLLAGRLGLPTIKVWAPDA